jgi:hypothetical protein
MIGRAQALPVNQVWSTPMYTGLPLEPDQFQFHWNALFGQVTPPFRIMLSPAPGEAEAQDPEQPAMPGAFFHGVVLDVPLLPSLPPE